MNPNPPAFPAVCLNDPGHPMSEPGMSLRDWFAGQALAGLLADGSPRALDPAFLDLGPDARARVLNDQLAIGSYMIADAMLEARKQVQP